MVTFSQIDMSPHDMDLKCVNFGGACVNFGGAVSKSRKLWNFCGILGGASLYRKFHKISVKNCFGRAGGAKNGGGR